MTKDELPKRKARQPKGARGEAWGILNPYGDLWTWQTFETQDEAMEHVARVWRPLGGTAIQGFKPIRVNVHVTALKARHD